MRDAMPCDADPGGKEGRGGEGWGGWKVEGMIDHRCFGLSLCACFDYERTNGWTQRTKEQFLFLFFFSFFSFPFSIFLFLVF